MASTAYWIGNDGNVYAKGASFNGVQNIGTAGSVVNQGRQVVHPNGTTTLIPLSGFIANPGNANAASGAPANPNGTAGGGATTADKSNDIALQLAGLGSADQNASAGVSAVDKALGSLTGQYDTETTQNEGNYKTQSDSNENNLQKNKQSALLNAAQGRQGLFGTLSSIGALNGSGIKLANNAVQKGANDDLSGAADNFATNQSGLDTAIGTYRTEDARRRQDAQTAADNAKTKVQNDTLTSKQGFYSNLANDYSAQGDAGNASHYSDLAASLFPQIAATNVPQTALGYSGATFTPGTLASYLAGANSTQVSSTPATPGSNIPGLVAGSPDKRKVAQPA